MLSSHSLSWEFSLLEWQIDIAIWTRVTDHTPKASYLIWCCRSSEWVTSRDRIIVCVKGLSWQRFWTSTKKKRKDQASQGDTFKRLIPFLFCCNLVLVCKVTVFYLIVCMYINLICYILNMCIYWTSQSYVCFRILCIFWDLFQKEVVEMLWRKPTGLCYEHG